MNWPNEDICHSTFVMVSSVRNDPKAMLDPIGDDIIDPI